MYEIIRYKFNGKPKLIHANVTLEQAQEWCSSEFTRNGAKKWFDGFVSVRNSPFNKNVRPMYHHYFTPTSQE